MGACFTATVLASQEHRNSNAYSKTDVIDKLISAVSVF